MEGGESKEAATSQNIVDQGESKDTVPDAAVVVDEERLQELMERRRKVEEIAMLPPVEESASLGLASKIIMEVALSIPEMSDKLREEMGLEQREWKRPRDVKPGLEAKYPRKPVIAGGAWLPFGEENPENDGEAAAGDAGAGEEEEDGK